jgi:NAD(P)H-dependent FMN reductase
MAAIPGPNVRMGPPRFPQRNPIQQSLNTLRRSINQLNHSLTVVNQRSVRDLTRNLRDYADAIGNWSAAFSKADSVQVKALAVGSSLKKVLEINNTALNKMQGSFFENAEELLLNFVEGIRENSDDLNTLNNRMRLTNQSTALLRQVMGALSVVTGGNLEAVSQLSRSNVQLSNQFGVTSESLLQAIASVSNLIDQASFVNSANEVADLAQSVRALAGDKAATQANKVLSFFLDPKFLANRFALGIGQAEDILTNPSLTTNERLQTLVELTSLTSDKLKDLNNVDGLSNKIFRSELALSRFGDTDILRAIVNLDNTMNVQLKLQNALRDDQSSILDSARTTDEIARSFYQESLANFYPTILQLMKVMAPAAVGAGLGTVAGGIGGALLSRAGLAGIGNFIRFLGPIGFAAGTILTFLPEITSIFKGSNSEEAEQTKVLKEILDRTPKIQEDRISRSGSVSDFILKNVGEIISKSQVQTRNNPQLDTLRDILSEIRDGLNRKSTLPSETTRTGR